MCGIAGFLGNKLHSEQIRLMTDAMSRRGPDATGEWSDKFCTLGHRRLSIIDLSVSANQPMLSSDDRYVMVYNGEVFNFQEIASEIKKHAPGFMFRTTSDTEVILEAFRLWGPSMVTRLNGMFAIAIYDTFDKNLYLFRDRIGIKPIYIYNSQGCFAFSSELKGITALPEVRKELTLDNDSIEYYMHLGYIPAPLSVWKQVKKFPQGSWAVIDAKGNMKTECYWSLEKTTKPFISDEKEAIAELEQLLLTSVRYRMISDVPFGTFLSGGIDSSIVTALAQQISSVPVNTFSIGFKESSHNESKYARAVAEHLQTKHHEFVVSEKDVLPLISYLPDIYDEPFADDSALPTLLVSKLAREHVTMTLSGDGGDELFFGYGAYSWAKRLQHPVMSIFRNPLLLMLNNGNSRMKRAGWVLNYPAKNHIPSHIFSQEQYYFSRKETEHIFGHRFGQDALLKEYYNFETRKLQAEENQSLFDLHYYLPDMLLVKVDRASMYHSLETRVPLLDYRIVEFANNLHPSLRARNGIQKYILKKVLYKYLPEHLFDRPKWGFSLPLPAWMRNELKDLVLTHLHSDELIKLFGKDITKSTIFKDWHSGNDLYYNRIWQLVVLSMWLQSVKK